MTAPTLDQAATGPAPDDGLTPTVRAMRDELAEHYKGADPGSVTKAMEAMAPTSAVPKAWEKSRDLAGKAVKAYREQAGIPPKAVPARKATGRTVPAKPRRTVVQESDRTAVQPPVVPQPADPVQTTPVPQPEPTVRTGPVRRAAVWPVILLAAPAFVAIWSGWVGLGGLTGFGIVHPLPGIWDSLSINSAITLPIGVETYGAYALYVWLSGRVPERARRFAKWSAIASLVVGAAGQVAYHLLVAAGVESAPWQITTLVSCLPVAVLGMGAALAHLVREEN